MENPQKLGAELLARQEELSDLEERVAALKRDIHHIRTASLPDAMDIAGVREFVLLATGNRPARRFRAKPMISANIAAGWEASRREAGFQAVIDAGGEALIKREISTAVDVGDKEAFDRLMNFLAYNHLPATTRVSIHPKTLGSWLGSLIRDGQPTPDLDLIGGFVGRIVDIKDEG